MNYTEIMQRVETIGTRVLFARRQAGMNQAELAQMLERHGVRITGSQISNIEHGKKSPSWEVAVALASELGVSLDYLAMRTDVQDVAGETDTAAANAWLRQHIRVHVGRNQIDFEWL